MDVKDLMQSRLAARLQCKLMLEESLPRAYAAILAEEALNRFDDRVRAGVLLWLEDELPEDFSVEDANLPEILEYFGLKGFPALCVMDMYLKNPGFVSDELIWLEERYL